MKRALLAATLCLGLAAPAAGEQLVTQLSRNDVAITSSFAGETLTLFGQIQPSVGSGEKFVEGPYHIIITVTGPLQKRVARRKTNNLGIWFNTSEVVFDQFPSFYQVLADAKIDDITDAVTLAQRSIPFAYQTAHPVNASWWDAAAFGTELVRMMTEKGQFKLNEQGVTFRSDNFYFAQVALPSDAPPGPYLTRTYLFRDGKLIAERAEGFSVRKTGFERFLWQAAHTQPLLYGLTAVVLALFTGWLGGVVFRR